MRERLRVLFDMTADSWSSGWDDGDGTEVWHDMHTAYLSGDEVTVTGVVGEIWLAAHRVVHDAGPGGLLAVTYRSPTRRHLGVGGQCF